MAIFKKHTVLPRFTMVLAIIGLCGALSACVGGGTTYGTGTSQESQTISDLAGIVGSKAKKPRINYAARPDLIVPENRQNLPDPLSSSANKTETSAWPEAPEQRIARIRQEAEDAEANSITRSQFAKKKKGFSSAYRQPNQTIGAVADVPIGQGIPNATCDPNIDTSLSRTSVLKPKISKKTGLRYCTSAEISAAVKNIRASRQYGTSNTKRKYLTEPPTAYRETIGEDGVDDLGYSEAELKRIAEEKKRLEKELR